MRKLFAPVFAPFLAALIGVSLFAAAPSQAAEDPVYQTFLGTAINGYDPVAYFTEGKPVEGSSDHAYEWNGADWHFASAGNLEKFKADPEKYAPQYGGYCAYAVSEGYTAKTEPDAWKIVDGKLYLNYNKEVQDLWSQDIPGRIANADKQWPKVLGN
ncbi:YHS domain-containing (seleno)protein [Hwanghaeella sp.]|uniref:YHS domain-containing (seleno)protein n=1 Tax=Hwanghaeella sp. TaxID=2605943 RepID=UPI003CCC1698